MSDERGAGPGTSKPGAGRNLAEAIAAGLAFGSALCWAGTCLVGSFRPAGLAVPYWSDLPWLRTDTCGIIAFALLTISFPVSEYLRRLRGRGTSGGPECGRGVTLAVTLAWTTATLGAALVVYLSVNAVTHPITMGMAATHVLPWPTEGTLRVVALLGASLGVAAQRLASSFGEPPGTVPGESVI
ncbi:MAG: hypothetical protein ACYCO9_11840 [Streptosporangiaceae bacterium]